ncbi:MULTISPECIES: EamA family transporter [Silvimonas]|uniref:EamA family transporter n=1 Tax=Silvimonas TaxID=300264 RepID=UPI0024B3B4B1|nr:MULTISPECIES: EamA family transporter [Silvimonas]MDR3426434.1 EamA family transporter [Silvimonas sp.]
MTRLLFVLILISVSCSAFAQMLLKRGMVDASVQDALRTMNLPALATGVALNPWVLSGLALYFGGAVVWLGVLARVDVSTAYPFVALGLIVTVVLGGLVFNEQITAWKIAGSCLVALGVYLVGAK